MRMPSISPQTPVTAAPIPQGADGDEQLRHGFARVAEIKIMDTEGAEKNTQQPRGKLGFLRRSVPDSARDPRRDSRT